MLISPKSKLSPVQVRSKERAAPIKGMNNRLPVQAVGDNGFAIAIENWICRPNGLVLRNGWLKTAQAGVSSVKSLLVYERQVFGRIDDDWTGAEIKNTGGLKLVATGRGVADPIWFNGQIWQTAVILGANPKSLRGCTAHGERLFFYGAGSLDLYYLGIDYVGGPLSHIPLHEHFRKGGQVAAIGSMTADGAVGGNDQFVIATTNGEILVFSGPNPDNAAQWSKIGVFDVAKPVGPHALFRSGSGLNMITDKGLMNVPSMLSAKASEREAAMLSASIDFPDGTATSGIDSEQGFFTLVHCREATGNVQYVQDPETKGWSRLAGLGATCWAESPDGLYFGRTDGSVARYEGHVDNRDLLLPDGGDFIRTLCVDGYSHYGQGGAKAFKKARLLWQHAMPYRSRMELMIDYEDVPVQWQSNYIDATSWDAQLQEVVSGTPMRRPVTTAYGAWRGIAGRGVSATLALGAAFHGFEAIYYGHELEYNIGGRRR
jgi:hypothetical protein